MSRSIKLVDVAPTMARALGVKTPPIDGRPIRGVEGWDCDRVALAIVDSLGYGLYRSLELCLPNMRSMATEGLLLEAEAVAPSTTPAIASILTGLLPQNHGISTTSQASESEIRSLLEWAGSEGVRSAVVMEEEGARTFQGFVEIVLGVPRSLSAPDFDRQILARSLEALEGDPSVLVAHFVGIDRAAHRGGGDRGDPGGGLRHRRPYRRDGCGDLGKGDFDGLRGPPHPCRKAPGGLRLEFGGSDPLVEGVGLKSPSPVAPSPLRCGGIIPEKAASGGARQI